MKNKSIGKKLIICIFFAFILFFTHIMALEATDCGDVDNNSFINVIDALLIARYYAGLDPDNFDPLFANVDGSDFIDIIDALLVAQYSVNLITEFPGACETPLPTETPDPTTPPPTPDPVNPLNLGDLLDIIPLSASEEDQLISNGFLVLDSVRKNTLTESYKLLSSQDKVSTFITTDTLLHIFHITYAHMLEVVEKEYLIQEFTDILTWFETDVSIEYGGIVDKPFLKEACRRLWIFAAVARALINGVTSINGSADITSDVNDYLDKIYACSAVEPFPGEDYTHYKPRSHYVNSEQLKQYFRAMTWCERQKYDIDDDYDIAAAAIMAWLILNDITLKNAYESLYTILSKLKNTVITVTPPGVNQAMQDAFESTYQTNGYALLEEAENLIKLKEQFHLVSYGEDSFIQFFGEHKALDLLVFKQTTHPLVENRYIPAGLDVASALFNSQAAYDEFWLEKEEFPLLMQQLDALKTVFNEKQESDWTNSTSNFWLYTLRTLSFEPPGMVPSFMKTGIWEREKLNSQLASWTELHSDSVYVPSTPTPSPIPTPSSTPAPGAGYVWLMPGTITVDTNSEFVTDVYVNTGIQKIAAYGFDITYDEDYIDVNTAIGEYGVEEGADGFVSAVNVTIPDTIKVTGFDVNGRGPGTELHLLIINWKAGTKPGIIPVEITIETLVDENTYTIGTPTGIGNTVIISGGIFGDVNGDGAVDIVDALLTAQYYVGLDPIHFNPGMGDVDCDGIISIVDALLMAQYYVGLITQFPCEPGTPTPMSTPVVTSPPGTATPTPVAMTSTPTAPPTPTPSPPACFVEPYPVFYERLKGMCNQVINTLNTAGISIIHTSKLQKIHDWSDTFGSYAQTQLSGISLTSEENAYIHNFHKDLSLFFSDSSSFIPEPYSQAQVVSAIYTYEEQVLHEAIGYIHPVIVIYPLPGQTDGMAAVGYVLSYYEFEKEDSVRLTDEEWVQILSSDPPERPLWAKIFLNY
ncbi:MAG: DUF3160 domain-containing protein [Spirochaetales bacterium]|nr:DUF3160 domain-containing protein [Spirochaetales bacterium]